jgi:transcription initiation factor TFIIIB Brf1 subunit/transcription initiation factor TFIIB
LSTQGLNGEHAVTDARDPLNTAVLALEEMLPALQAEREQAEAHLREVSDRERRVRSGIAALTGDTKAEVVAAPAQGRKLEKKTTKNPPSQKMQDDVYALIARASEPPTINEIADQLDVSRSAIDNTVRHLRRNERVRLAGVRKNDAGRNAGHVFGVMP